MTEIPRPWVDDRSMQTFAVLIAPVSAAVDSGLGRTVATAFEEAGFSAVESILGSGERIQAICDEAAGGFDVLVTLGGLRVNGDPDIADVLRGEVEVELPGLAELLRREQFAAGHRRSVFETPLAGRLEDTLVVTLPDDPGAVEASAPLLAGLAAELLAERDLPPADGIEFDLDAEGGDAVPWPVVVDEPHPDATILHMWGSRRRPGAEPHDPDADPAGTD